jgi:hypothetical protein
MKQKRLAMLVLAVPAMLAAQGNNGRMSPEQAERICSTEVQRRMNARNQDVDVIYQREDSNRNTYRVDWRLNSRGNDSRGSCLIDQNGRVQQFNGGNRGGNNGGGYGKGKGNGGFPGKGGGFPGNNNPPPGVSNYARVRLDTSGRGTFNGRGITAKVTRGWVDTLGNTSVQLTGDRDFRVTFYGVVERANGDRNFTLRITNSTLGPAQGTAQVQLNGDKNEVESINVNGRINGDQFNANFNR